MPNCPQCKELIEGIAHTTYVVGWCQQDVHVACYLLHLRSCRPCWRHNAVLAGFEREKG